MKKGFGSPSIYNYNDFRKFLEDYQVARSEREPDFSKSEFSRQLNLPNTRSYLTDVLKGKKVSETFVDRFIAVIGFNREESQYFRALVHFNQADNVDERELFFEQLIELNRTPIQTLEKTMMRYYGSWHNGIVRALCAIEDFAGDYASLAKKVYPPLTPSETEAAVTLLLELGLLQRNGNGCIKPTEKSIRAPQRIREELLRQYQLQCLMLAQKTIAGGSKGIAFSYTNTISISEQGQKRLVKLLEKFQSQVRALVHKDEDQPDRIMQLNIILGKQSR